MQKWFRGHIEIGTSLKITKYKYSHEGGVSFCISFHLALNHIVPVSFARAGELFLYSSRSLWYYRRDDDISCCLYVQLFRFPSVEVRRFQARLQFRASQSSKITLSLTASSSNGGPLQGKILVEISMDSPARLPSCRREPTKTWDIATPLDSWFLAVMKPVWRFFFILTFTAGCEVWTEQVRHSREVHERRQARGDWSFVLFVFLIVSHRAAARTPSSCRTAF